MTLFEACNQIGIEYKDVPADGKIYYTAVTGKSSKNTSGRIRLFPDGMGGTVFNNAEATTLTFWYDDTPAKLTAEQKQERAARSAAAEQQAEADKAECRKKSAELWEKAYKETPADHPYLIKKRVKPYGIRWQKSGGLLVIPVIDMAGTLHGLQFVNAEGEKKFKSNTVKAGNFCKIPGKSKIVICEGWATGATIHEATGYYVIVAFDKGNLQAVAKAARDKWPERQIIIAADDDYSTKGNPGLTKATEAARAVNGLLAVPAFHDTRGAEDTDFNDMAKLTTPEAVRACIDGAAMLTPVPLAENTLQAGPGTLEPAEPDLDAELQRLASLSVITYERIRTETAAAMGIRATVLDKLVAGLRKANGTPGLVFEEVEPHPHAVNGAGLLSEIRDTVKRFIICHDETAVAVTLWIVMTWFIDVVQIAPLAMITAPEKRCGKSQLLFLIGKLVRRALAASGISPAALFRSIEKWSPTLLIDEADAFMKDNEDIRLLLNSGHSRDAAFIIRTVGDNHEPTRFNTWGAKAVCGISAVKIAETLTDRAVIMELRRKLDSESVERLRYCEPGTFEALTAKLARFAVDNREAVRCARPALPHQLNDRAQDNWEPLLAIATVAGGEWLQIATKAALHISGVDSPSMSTNTELLHDINAVFERLGVDRISTVNLIKELCLDDDAPWSTYNRGKQITPRQISKRLSEFGIISNTIRFGTDTAKGYAKEIFQDVFARYLSTPGTLSVTPSQASIGAGLGVTEALCVTVTKNEKVTARTANGAGCDVVTDRTPEEPLFINEADLEGAL